MLEFLLVLSLLGCVSVALVVVYWVPWAWLWVLGVVASGVGLLVGVPAALRYHVVLHRVLSARGALPRGWWVSPQKLHPVLREEERGRVLPWWWLGGAGFVLVICGAGLLAFALWTSPAQLPEADWLQWLAGMHD